MLQYWRNQLVGGPQPKLVFDGAAPTWAGGNVYYSFINNVSAVEQKAFLDCAAEWSTFANVHFIAHTTQANYVLVSQTAAGSLEGGESVVGMVGGVQGLEINPTAWNHATICHELGQTLGLVHEQQHSDRSSYVTILTNNTNTVIFSSASGVVYRVQYRNDVFTNNRFTFADQLMGTVTNILLTDPAASLLPKHFYRA